MLIKQAHSSVWGAPWASLFSIVVTTLTQARVKSSRSNQSSYATGSVFFTSTLAIELSRYPSSHYSCTDNNVLYEFSRRSPHYHNISMGSISQAETVLASSQQALVRLRPDRSSVGIPGLYQNNSGGSTPSGSMSRNVTRDSLREPGTPGWKVNKAF